MSEGSASAFPGVSSLRLHRPRRSSWGELAFTAAVTLHKTPRHSSTAPRDSSGINGDVDIFRQSVYLILMLSNRSQRPPHPTPHTHRAAQRNRRRRPRRLASRASLPIHPSRLPESITMALPLFRVMSVLFHLSFQPDISRRPPPGLSSVASQVPDMKMRTFMTHLRDASCLYADINL